MLGSEVHVEQFWQIKTNNHRDVNWSVLQWGGKVFESIHSFTPSQFNPYHKTIGEIMKPNFGASSLSCSANDNRSLLTKQRICIASPGDYDNNTQMIVKPKAPSYLSTLSRNPVNEQVIITNEQINRWIETECPWLTSWMLTSSPEIILSNLMIACLLCHNQNVTLDF